MNYKHLALLGVIALVVFGCVLAAGCTSTQQIPEGSPMSSVVGEWYCPEFTGDDGDIINGLQTIKADGTGYWMRFAEDNPGAQLVEIYGSQFTAPDRNGVFEKVSSRGSSHQLVYYPANDTIIQDGEKVYTRLDPLVGIWYGMSANVKGGKITTLFKPDGTGTSTLSNADNGTAEVFLLTWEKNADGTYTAKYSNGKEGTYSVDPSGLTASFDGSSVRTKAFTDIALFMSITGAWYSEEKDLSAVFNADGTGFLVNKNGAAPFTWRVTDFGTFEIIYSDGTASDGSDLKGRTVGWTYDRANDVFTSAYGTRYIHPAESIEGKITLS